MTQLRVNSEIRRSTISDLLRKVTSLSYAQYLRSLDLSSIRMFAQKSITFDFPVTALIGPNGSGKSTILHACAAVYTDGPPRRYFRKCRFGDENMDNWSIGYSLVDKSSNAKELVTGEIRFSGNKWSKHNPPARTLEYLGIWRTVPPFQSNEIHGLNVLTIDRTTSGQPAFTVTAKGIDGSLRREVERILGKPLPDLQLLDIGIQTTKRRRNKRAHERRKALLSQNASENFPIKPLVKNWISKQTLFVGSTGTATYSEFNFGAGEASIIRTVAKIESLPDSSLVLIEEIENGLHPLAVRRFVEYLISTAEKKRHQIIFTTHSEYALDVLPPQAVWAALNGDLFQGVPRIEMLRALAGRVDKLLSLFVEDEFAANWIRAVLRAKIPTCLDQVEIYQVGGDGNAVKIHMGHNASPARSHSSACYLDGDSQQKENIDAAVYRLPGLCPETTVFTSVVSNLEDKLDFLTIALQLGLDRRESVRTTVHEVQASNRDPHLLFSQLGSALGSIAVATVEGAFFSLWIQSNGNEAERIARNIKHECSRSTPP